MARHNEKRKQIKFSFLLIIKQYNNMTKKQQYKNVKLANYLEDCLCHDDYTNNDELFNYHYNLYNELINKTPILKNRIKLIIK